MPLSYQQKSLSLIKHSLSLVFFILLTLPIYSYEKQKEFSIDKVNFHGFDRTKESWALYYLGLERLPISLSQEEANKLAQKLLTTEAFSKVTVQISPSIHIPTKETFILSFVCEEKWTTLPVAQAKYSGNTPLLVLGLWDINSFGRLWTFGGEMRRFGKSDPGGVIYAKAPRWLRGRHSIGTELWEEKRLRSLFDQEYEAQESYLISGKRIRVHFLLPFPLKTHDRLQWGLDLWTSQLKSKFLEDDSKIQEPNIDSSQNSVWEWEVTPHFVFDDMNIDNVLYSGARISYKFGLLGFKGKTKLRYEFSSYSYWLFGPLWNLGLRVTAGYKPTEKFASRYFLGGFDTVRGLPDGYFNGTYAAYSNLELRYFPIKKLIWVELSSFLDLGSAADSWSEVKRTSVTAGGVGIRLAAPYIHGLVVRIDYAWNLKDPSKQGISLDLKQFLEPQGVLR